MISPSSFIKLITFFQIENHFSTQIWWKFKKKNLFLSQQSNLIKKNNLSRHVRWKLRHFLFFQSVWEDKYWKNWYIFWKFKSYEQISLMKIETIFQNIWCNPVLKKIEIIWEIRVFFLIISAANFDENLRKIIFCYLSTQIWSSKIIWIVETNKN